MENKINKEMILGYDQVLNEMEEMGDLCGNLFLMQFKDLPKLVQSEVESQKSVINYLKMLSKINR